ncbi:hypothetical protein [Crocinitomix algicola]|uniref:hypothetical protein n=1 Tax=Crocinitomix algicola TaxID=1740263 RepID=UPI00082D65E1|nr:hypothetical protein [Crocinitomix algicola]
MRYLSYLLLFFSWFNISLIQAQNSEIQTISAKNYSLKAVAEIGFLAVLDHKIQFGQNGTYFNYRQDGGQDVLFPIIRPSLELTLKERNIITFLYQPLRLESTVYLNDNLIVDDLVYPAGTSVNLLYNFPFYRASYMRELMPDNEKWSFALGGTIQIRNATISFESTNGNRFRTNRDVGIVPALKFRTRYQFNENVYSEIEADGIYAPVSYLNGSTNEIIGAILDASYRSGIKIHPNVNAFLNLRYLGGGAVGTSENDPGPGDGYVKNWLHFGTVSTGFVYEF